MQNNLENLNLDTYGTIQQAYSDKMHLIKNTFGVPQIILRQKMYKLVPKNRFWVQNTEQMPDDCFF